MTLNRHTVSLMVTLVAVSAGLLLYFAPSSGWVTALAQTMFFLAGGVFVAVFVAVGALVVQEARRRLHVPAPLPRVASMEDTTPSPTVPAWPSPARSSVERTVEREWNGNGTGGTEPRVQELVWDDPVGEEWEEFARDLLRYGVPIGMTKKVLQAAKSAGWDFAQDWASTKYERLQELANEGANNE